MRRTIFDDHHDLFRDSVRQWVDHEMVPHHADWEKAGIVPKSVFRQAGELGFLGMAVPEEYGGGGVDDFRFNAILSEEFARAGVAASGLGMQLHNDICLPYFLEGTTEDQKLRWLPGLCSGEHIAAIAMTEPGAGSDLAGMSTNARRDGDDYIVNGAKTFITNGINSTLVITALKTDPTQKHRGMSVLVIEDGTLGFERGRNLDKIGLKSQDTAELFFTDARVAVANRLGDEGTGFFTLVRNLPQERLSIAVSAVAQARAALDWTLTYARERQAFGQPIGSFQHNRFKLAEMETEVDVAQAYIDAQITALNAKQLSAEDAAKAKWWSTEMQNRVADACLQLHGGYGYMTEYPIARQWQDARIQTIYGGTTEIMLEIIGRSLGV
jgi:alkylation response protein AidB-like acyl-CoA dehydrogenase